MKRTESGFALLYVLSMLALLTIVITALSQTYQSQLSLVSFFKETEQEKLALEKLFAELAYQLSSAEFNSDGFTSPSPPPPKWPSKYYADNRKMMIDGWEVRLQDSGGLVSINVGTELTINRLLTLINVPKANRKTILAQWQDYLDSDDNVRSNGRESSENALVRNGPATNISEFLNLPAVAALPAEQISWLAAKLTTDRPPGISLHTSSPEVVHARQDVSFSSAKAFVNELRQNPEANPTDLFGGAWTDDTFSILARPTAELRACVKRLSFPSWLCRVYDFAPFDYRAGIELKEQFQLPANTFQATEPKLQ